MLFSLVIYKKLKLKVSRFVLVQTLQDCEEVVGQQDGPRQNDNIPTEILDCIKIFNDVFLDSMSEDLHSPVVLSAISDPLKTANDLLHTRKVLHFSW